MKRHGLLDFNEAVQNPGKHLSFDIQTELNQEADLDLIKPISGSLEGVSTGNALLLQGEFSTTVIVECARCGEPIEQSVQFEMTDEFEIEGIPSCYASDGYAEVVSDEPVSLFDKNALHIDQYARQGLLLNLPTQPLCSGSWDIPCPNSVQNDVKTESGHPAMKQLEQFRSQLD